MTVALPLVGVLALLGLLAYAQGSGSPAVRYEGRAYTGGAAAGPSAAGRLGAVPTDDRVDGRQVWVRQSRREPAGPPSLVLLEAVDGSFRIYTPLGEP